jgi:predicted lipid-binding transport protein (Tim44 family)
MLHDIAQAAVVLGIPVVLSAWLAGTTRPAVALRRSAAPTLRDRPGLAYGLAVGVLALFVAWGPIHATRLVIPVLSMLALVVLGVYVLRRQTAEEFPDAAAGATRASVRARAEHVWAAIASARRPAAPAPAPPAAPAPATSAVAVQAAPDHVGQLERLARLHDSGSLTDEEFDTEKALVLAGNGAPH